MLNYTSDKKAAYFHVFSPELFFEAEAMDSATLIKDLWIDLDVDAALENLLGNAQEEPAAA